MHKTMYALLISAAGLAATSICSAQCEVAQWSPAPGLAAPRYHAAAAYDTVRNRLVVFGGQLASGVPSNVTLEFDGTQWLQRSPGGTIPSPRYAHCMAFDSARGVMVMFGGVTSSGVVGGTFEYDGNNWTTAAVTNPPLARRYAAMAYDSQRSVIVMQGGRNETTTLSQTLEYDGTAWVQRSTGGPGPRTQHCMAFDSRTHRMVLFGGQAVSEPATGTWTWDGAAWSLVPGNEPPTRSWAAMAYVPQRQRTLLFGGGASTPGLWEFDGAAWHFRNSSGPANRIGHSMALVSSGTLMMLGGLTGTGAQSDAWLLDTPAGAPTFTQSPSSQSIPAGQQVQFAAAADGAVTSWSWQRNGEPIANNDRISGASSPTLTIAGLLAADAGQYRAQAANSCGSNLSNPATLTIIAACSSSDFNGDGDSGTDADIESFFACLAGSCCPTCYSGGADFNADGDSGTDADIESFFRVLAGGPC